MVVCFRKCTVEFYYLLNPVGGANFSCLVWRIPACHLYRIHQHDDPGMRLQDDSTEQRGKIMQYETPQRNIRADKRWMFIQGRSTTGFRAPVSAILRSEEHTSELQSH